MQIMVLVYETENFVVNSFDKNPHIGRCDGGHLKLSPKVRVCSRCDLSPKLAIEMIKITMLIGESMTKGLISRGIDIGRINYQDNGNWSVFKPEGPYLHIHFYGRAKSAKKQKYGQALVAPHINDKPEFYAENKPLNLEDINAIKLEIKKLINTEKYSDSNWNF